MKNREVQKLIVMLYLRKRMARRDLAEYLKKDKTWEAMKDQARGSFFEATMALRAARGQVVDSFRKKW
jgi:hypothetical protein